MSKKGRVRESTAIQWVAMSIPAMSALPSAYFVARSSYYHLILNWHMTFWPVLAVAVAVIIGLIVEGLGTVAIFLALTFHRWNAIKAKLRGYDKAPFGLAVLSVGIYIAATAVLLAVLETWPVEAARYAPMVFPFMTVVGGLCWAMYDQHRDRLSMKGLAWNWVALPSDESDEKESKPVQKTSGPVRFESKVDRQAWMLDHIASNGETAVNDLVRVLDVGRTTVYTDLSELEKAGRVSRNNGTVRAR